MRLPKDLLSGMYTKPRLFLCETDGSRICQLESQNLSGSFSFNSVSELSFEVSRFYNDMLTGETKVNPFYDKVEGIRVVELEDFGFFEIQGPTISGDGINEKKSVNAKSLEYTLSNKYLKNFYINTGDTAAVEVTYAEEQYGADFTAEQLKSVSFYDTTTPGLSLLHLMLEKAYGWTIGHVDDSLKTLTRKFEVDRQSIYDFIMNDVCSSFNCYAVFDTLNKKISFYSESLTSKFFGDGTTTNFTISPPFSQVSTVSVGGYKTTQWNYNNSTGVITLTEAPENGVLIEVVDGGLKAWETDVFITFDNLAQTVDVNYDADSIKTVLTVKFGEDENIREVNFGSSDLMDLSYYHTVDWMGQDLYDKYTEYLQQQNLAKNTYAANSKEILEIENRINFETNKMSLEYGVTQAVTSTTVGEYYVRMGATPNHYYKKVELPGEYVAGTTYYKDGVVNITEDKMSNFYTMLQKYFYGQINDEDADDTDDYDYWHEYFNEKITIDGVEFDNPFVSDFKFVETELVILKEGLDDALNDVRDFKNDKTKVDGKTKINAADECIKTFLNRLWTELGKTPLEQMFLDPYKKAQSVNIEAGWSDESSNNYPRYYPILLMIETIEDAIEKRNTTIEGCKNQQKPYQTANSTLSSSINMNTFFTEQQLIRLNAFLREDELQLDDIVITDLDSLSDSFKMQQHAMESGKLELNKLCQPQLSFSMTMANIYALPEFNPIIHQFQLGNVIKVALRDDYIKQSRLLGVNINFEDFSDFSVEFGELTNLTKQSDIHADLLSKAIQAGKEVASSSGIWTSGADMATETDLKIQNGLISATNSIKSIDGNQAIEWDNWGLHLRKWANSDKTEYDDKQAWFVNNSLLFTDDGWKTSRAGIGEFDIEIDGETSSQYGVIADAVLAGYIEGSTMKGGTINIGDGAFKVDDDGTVTMSAPNNDIGLNIYSAIVNFFEGTNIFAQDQEFIAGYIDLYKNGDLEETIKVPNYYSTPITIDDDDVIFDYGTSNSPDIDITTLDDDGNTIVEPHYFVYKYITENNEIKYEMVVGELNDDEQWVISDNYLDDYQTEYSYRFDNMSNNFSNVFVVGRSDVDRTKIINVDVCTKDTNEISVMLNLMSDNDTEVDSDILTTAYITLIDLNDTFVGNTTPINPYIGQMWLDTTDSILKVYNGSQWEASFQQNGQTVYTTQPTSYNLNDIWIVENGGYSGTNSSDETVEYDAGTLLKAKKSSTIFSIDDWQDAMSSVTTTVSNINQYMKFVPSGDNRGLKISEQDDKFYVRIRSDKMGFYDNSGNTGEVEVVSIGSDSATINNAIIDKGATFECSATFNNSDAIKISGKESDHNNFIFRIEDNGSLSLCIDGI